MGFNREITMSDAPHPLSFIRPPECIPRLLRRGDPPPPGSGGDMPRSCGRPPRKFLRSASQEILDFTKVYKGFCRFSEFRFAGSGQLVAGCSDCSFVKAGANEI